MTTTEQTTIPPRPSAASLHDHAGRKRETQRGSKVAWTGTALFLTGIALMMAGHDVAAAAIAGIVVTLIGMFAALAGLLVVGEHHGSRAETQRRLAADLSKHYGVTEIDDHQLPTWPGSRETLTVRRGDTYLTVIAAIPSETSPIVLLDPEGRELPAA